MTMQHRTRTGPLTVSEQWEREQAFQPDIYMTDEEREAFYEADR